LIGFALERHQDVMRSKFHRLQNKESSKAAADPPVQTAGKNR
jgi:hypothetical protein